jgi:hypothetical protein
MGNSQTSGSGSKPGSCCRLDRSLFSLFAAWFPGGATISRPYGSSFPAPRRTGLGVLHHPAPSLSHPRSDGRKTHRLPPPASSERRSLTCLAQGHRHADRVKRAHFSCHGQSPLGVGPCIRSTLSQTATPLLGPHYRVSTLVWVAPTSKHHRPCPRSYTCSRVPASHGPTLGSPWLPRILNVRLDTASDPGEYSCRSPERDTNCCLPAGQNRRHSPTKIFGAQHLQGRLHPLPLHLACFRAYASTRLLPVTPQGSILGSRLTITQAGLAPTRTRDLARPH